MVRTKKPEIVALMSDLGNKDFFVGAMKGTILKINPQAKVVDITHEVPKFNIWSAGFTLFQAARSFSHQTVFVTVVDPGVGSCRRCLLLETKNGMYFIAPDNGVLTLVVHEFGKKRAWEIRNRALMAPKVSHTFHGRDVMAPVAAHLTLGVDPSEVGPPVDDIELLPLKRVKKERKTIISQVIYIDDFGNIVTNIPEEMVDLNPGEKIKVRIGKKEVSSFYGITFCDVPVGEYVCFIGSTGMLEFSKNQQNAAKELNVKVGDDFVIMGE